MIRKRTSSFKPRLEALEDRSCPSGYSIIDLPPLPGTTYSSAAAVNDAGWVVGNGINSDSRATPVLWRVDSAGKVVTTALPVGSLFGGSADDVNNLGQVAGTSDVPDARGVVHPHAAVWQMDVAGNFVAHDLGTLGGDFTQSWAHGISESNAFGQVLVVGQSDASTASVILRHAVAWQVDTAGNVFKTIDLEPGATDSNAWGVYKNGQIVGSSNASGSQHAILWQVDSLGNIVSRTDLGTLPSGASSYAYDVNSQGQVVGGAATGKINRSGNENSDAVLWKNGTITDLGSLGDAGSHAAALNDSGAVVGSWIKTQPDPFSFNNFRYLYRAFVWQNGVMTDLTKQLPKTAKWTLSSASDINSTGRIVGTGNVGTQSHGFLLVPTSALMAESMGSGATSGNLSRAQGNPVLSEALTRWQAAGFDVSALSSIDIRIADLGGTTLGLASGNTIWLDDNAAGWGWFVDPTPWDDSEFTTPGNQGEQQRMDLLTVLMHELGHVMGHDHDDGGVMAETLSAGTRLTLHGVDVQEAWWLAGLPDTTKKRDAFGWWL